MIEVENNRLQKGMNQRATSAKTLLFLLHLIKNRQQRSSDNKPDSSDMR